MFRRMTLLCICQVNIVACITACIVATLAMSSIASAQAPRKKPAGKDKADDPPAVEMLHYTAPREIEMLVGLRVTTTDGAMAQTLATTVFPTEWPEQKVEILEVNVPAGVQHTFRDLPGNNRQLVFTAPTVPAFQKLEATLKLKITKSHITGPEDPSTLVIPNQRQLSKEVKLFTGNSPFIDASSGEVRRIARDIANEKPETAWQHVESIYKWVRENIEYTRGELKDTHKTLKEKKGDCEEMTSLFVALCRASDIPARCVWIPGHCYPEFYLEDADGHGFWFPCQAAGSEHFGEMPEYLPILQKGDRFKVLKSKRACATWLII